MSKSWFVALETLILGVAGAAIDNRSAALLPKNRINPLSRTPNTE
jgi:hypothetical protein